MNKLNPVSRWLIKWLAGEHTVIINAKITGCGQDCSLSITEVEPKMSRYARTGTKNWPVRMRL